ncbi:MAG: hypothetical protein MUO61_03515 [Dehalococcoidia bacterium]|nr:hypothetical protein [Dehalococcoidia bacterium]
MKLEVQIELNLKVKEVQEKVIEASRMAMRDTTVDVTHDAVQLSPWRTGNNRRSITGEVSGMGVVATGGEGGTERVVDDSKIEGAIFSTSGYGGYLETGHHTKSGSFVAARPYFKPSLDMNFTQEKFTEKVREHLK